MKQESEVHLFIIWEKARYLEEKIIAKIESKFNIVQTYSITWSPYQVSNNFTRLYGANLPKNSDKEIHCGSGEFKLIVVTDNNPCYEERYTSKGVRTVNSNMFDTKSTLRGIVGGGHKIHGTDNEEETRHDLVLLTGLSVNDFLIKYPKRGQDIIYKNDLLGCYGWDNFDQLFYVLNECSENIVLRNVENINLKYINENGGDIDILAKKAEEIKYVLGDITSIKKESSHMHVSVEKSEVLIEIYQYGTNLYHKSFEDALFKSKIKTNNISHPNEEIEMYALIYHALLKKENFEDKHKKKIFNKYSQYLVEEEKCEIILLKKLINYFDINGYMFIKPDTGYFNLRPEIKDRLLINKNREGKIKKNLKKLLDIKYEGRKLQIYFLKIIKCRVLIKINFIKGISFLLSLGLK